MTEQDLYYLYDKLYIENKSPSLGAIGEFITDDHIATICRYACEYYLEWIPEYTVEHFNEDVIRRMKLGTVTKWLNPPADVTNAERMDYLLCKMYPDEMKGIGKVQRVIRCYNARINGEVSSFKRGFLSGSHAAEQNARICLVYALRSRAGCKTKEDCIRVMGSPAAFRFLKEARLNDIAKNRYASPLDFLMDSLEVIQVPEKIPQKSQK